MLNEDASNYWILDMLEYHTDGTQRLSHWYYDNATEAIEDVRTAISEGDGEPVALTWHGERGAYKVIGHIELIGAAANMIMRNVCMDHGMPAPWCKCA